jgi:hypothetical protein
MDKNLQIKVFPQVVKQKKKKRREAQKTKGGQTK